MRKQLFRFFTLTLTCVLLCSLTVLSACGKKKEYDFYLYFRDLSSDSLKKIPAETDPAMDVNTLISSVFASLKDSAGDASGYTSPVPADVVLNNYSLEENNLILDFNQAYPASPSKKELILRASLVLTYMQLADVSTVEIRIDGQPLTASDGSVIGPQKGSVFSDILGKGINEYATYDVTVYFANETGDKLIASDISLTAQKSVSLQQALVARLIRGPEDDAKGYEVLPVNTKLISVTTKDGICHVNLNSEILNEDVFVSPEVQIYAIVNTLTETKSVTSVMISVNGSSNFSYAETVDLSRPLERNLDLVEHGLQEEITEQGKE